MGVDTKWLAKHLEEQEARMAKTPTEIWCETGLYWDYKKDWSEGSWTATNSGGVKYIRADRIEVLIAERDEAWKRAGHAEKMWGETEVKLSESEALLAKAVEVAEKSIKWLRLYGAGVHSEAVALKKLTGGKDE